MAGRAARSLAWLCVGSAAFLTTAAPSRASASASASEGAGAAVDGSGPHPELAEDPSEAGAGAAGAGAAGDGAASREASLAEESSRVGEPVPWSQRPSTLPAGSVEVALRYGLVGTGPTRFVNDLRVGVTPRWELRTSFAPYPSSFMLRGRWADEAGPVGAWLLDVGLANWDAGFRLTPDEREADVGVRLTFEGAASVVKSFARDWQLFVAARYRHRVSLLPDDEQNAFAWETSISHDLLPWLTWTAGVAYAQTLGTPVREIAVSFLETGRPGVSHFLLRDDVWQSDLDPELLRQSLTVPLALTYGRTESFDVDLFVTPRVYPKFDIVLGAGIRMRFAAR